MPVPTHTLSAIQRAGQTVFEAHSKLATATQSCAKQVGEALTTNAFAVESDDLFNSWKTLARLTQEISGMEAQLRAIFDTASALKTNGIVISPKQRGAVAPKVKRKASTKTGSRLGRTPAAPGEVRGNNAKVLNFLETVLNRDGFTHIAQARIAEGANIPKGSINLAMRQLTEQKRVVEGDRGHYKLG